MQDLVRQKFDKNLSDPEEREILFEKFRTKITKKDINVGEKIYGWFFNKLKELLEINPFNKSE